MYIYIFEDGEVKYMTEGFPSDGDLDDADEGFLDILSVDQDKGTVRTYYGGEWHGVNKL